MRQLKITKNKDGARKAKSTRKEEELNLLNAIEKVVEFAENSNFNDEFFKKSKKYISYISEKLSLNDMQSVLLSLFVDHSDNNSIQISELTKYVNCHTIRIIRYMHDIDDLEQKKFIRCSRCNNKSSYRVTSQLLEALKKNEKYVPKHYKNISCNELFSVLDDLFEQRRESKELSYKALVNEINNLFLDNNHLLFVRKINELQSYIGDTDTIHLSIDEIKTYDGIAPYSYDTILFIYFCHLFVNKNQSDIDFYDFDYFFEPKSVYNLKKDELNIGYSSLIQRKLVEYVNVGGMADSGSIKLTTHAKKEFLSELKIKFKPNENDNNYLKHKDIVAKSMYYNERERKQIEQLTNLLQPEHFNKVSKRLVDNGMRNGFTCLFYGSPGTGKTETVFQIAKQTGRNIIQVNVAEIKSMWVGESEKNIKELFDKYRSYAKELEVAPILLFNEADAIIGKRQEGAEHAVEKMENSIQNIILQEMESLEGIMIATTNLTQNFDNAFERRFLYKIEFEKPTIEAKRAIWKSMIPALDETEVQELASSYEFSGGQIENIARKRTIDSILSGNEKIEIKELKQYCDSELIAKRRTRKKIGFV